MSNYGDICDRCRKAAPGLAWHEGLRKILCASCRRVWETLQRMKNQQK